MPPVFSAFLAFVVSLFRSRESLYLDLVLRHQLAVYQQSVCRPHSLRPIACSGPGSLASGPAGKPP